MRRTAYTSYVPRRDTKEWSGLAHAPQELLGLVQRLRGGGGVDGIGPDSNDNNNNPTNNHSNSDNNHNNNYNNNNNNNNETGLGLSAQEATRPRCLGKDAGYAQSPYLDYPY